MFQGNMVALVTPMHRDGSVDFACLRRLVDLHRQAKTDALVILGTTGEASVLNDQEQIEIIKTVKEQIHNQIPIIVGTGTNCTRTTIERTARAQSLGVDACLVVTPYYNKPTQEGLYQHYRTIAQQVMIPLILYNVPKRTGCDLLPETVIRLSKISNIVGVKEGQLSHVQEIANHCDRAFSIFSGDDDTGLAIMRAGGRGIVSVAANVIPDQMRQLCQHALQKDFESAEIIDQALKVFYRQLFVESNPIPVKWMLARMGLISEGIRLPLTPLSEQHHESTRAVMTKLGIQLAS